MWCVAWLGDLSLNVQAVGPFHSYDKASRQVSNVCLMWTSLKQ